MRYSDISFLRREIARRSAPVIQHARHHGRLQITPPAQLLDEVVLELLARDADLEVAQAGDLDGLGERGIGLEQGGRLEVGRPLLGLLQVLRLGPQVDDRLDPVRLLQAPPVRGRGVICSRCQRPAVRDGGHCEKFPSAFFSFTPFKNCPIF